LVGFSQGTMMSLYKAPRRSKPLACVLGYSGALLGGEGLSNNSAIQKCPIHLIHGDFDMVVPVASYYQAMSVLQQAGFSVTGSVTQGLSHSIDEAGLKEGLNFLKRCLYEAT
jgi:phospholipase/carboxylesterase